ncbi:MAG: hypothetical protein PVI01_03940 [Gemmatimonadales bacterium]|jgi:hypothetical protein
MKGQIPLLVAATLVCGCQGQAQDADAGSGPAGPFAVAQVHFEQNATDGDVEVVFEVKGGDEGLTRLTVTAPDGRAIVDFSAPASTLGMRQFRFESPEPGDVQSLVAAYPEGIYTFTGATGSGARLRGQSTLSHRLPPPTSFRRPGAEAGDFGVGRAVIEWEPIEDLSAYIVYVERRDQSVTARVAGSVTTFVVPDGFLMPGTTYQLGVGTVSGDGNISFVETMMTTGEGGTAQ